MSSQVRAPVPGLTAGEHTLSGPLGRYLARVLRLQSGDTFVAFDPAKGVEADAVVVRAERDHLLVRFAAPGPARVTAARSITLVQGLARGDKCDAIVRDATELGATRIVMTATRRSVVRLEPGRTAARQTRWTRIAEEAARQSGRADAPGIDDPSASWAEALARVDSGAVRFCLYEAATEPLAPLLADALAAGAPLAFAVGPEGGLDPSEVDEAKAHGWHVVSIGRFTLRTETVAAAVLGAVGIWADSPA
jgi:16S rRNA (uracil1498-N3)-methyltransferase